MNSSKDVADRTKVCKQFLCFIAGLSWRGFGRKGCQCFERVSDHNRSRKRNTLGDWTMPFMLAHKIMKVFKHFSIVSHRKQNRCCFKSSEGESNKGEDVGDDGD